MFTNFKQVLSFLKERENLGIKPGLDRINQLLAFLNHPEERVKAIHVAGTNGKGSTISFLKSALIHNNYKVGTFISPSVKGLTGHIFCNEQEITEEQFRTLLNNIYPEIQHLDNKGCSPTAFEIITVIAFMFFADHVDIALIETGMGGREDTTNCFQPILSIITTIDYDHTSFLGETLEEIAYHKAGIIKKNVPVIIGDIAAPAQMILQQEAHKSQAHMYRLYKEFTCSFIKQEGQYQSFVWATDGKLSFDVRLQMYGNHQVKNSSLALMALVYLKDHGYKIDWNNVLLGLKTTCVPGRFEFIQKKPRIVLDGAHNPAGIQTFIETMQMNDNDTDKQLIFAAFKDKDIKKMLEQLMPHFTSVILTTFDHPRAINTHELYRLVTMYRNKIVIEDQWKLLMDDSIQSSNKGNSYYVVGSLHFISLVRTYLNEIDQAPFFNEFTLK